MSVHAERTAVQVFHNGGVLVGHINQVTAIAAVVVPGNIKYLSVLVFIYKTEEVAGQWNLPRKKSRLKINARP